jgi:hypothetical protein
MTETNANKFAVGWLAQNAGIPEAAQRDLAMMTAVAQSMTGAIARLPRTMPWSVQPVVIMRVPQGPPERPIDKTKAFS